MKILRMKLVPDMYYEVYGKDIENETKVDAVSSATKKKTKKRL